MYRGFETVKSPEKDENETKRQRKAIWHRQTKQKRSEDTSSRHLWVLNYGKRTSTYGTMVDSEVSRKQTCMLGNFLLCSGMSAGRRRTHNICCWALCPHRLTRAVKRVCQNVCLLGNLAWQSLSHWHRLGLRYSSSELPIKMPARKTGEWVTPSLSTKKKKSFLNLPLRPCRAPIPGVHPPLETHKPRPP